MTSWPPSGSELIKKPRKVEAPAEEQRRVGEDLDWMRRRVREILEEYSRKAPPAEQWPPGRRIRVRGVEIHYKVSVLFVNLGVSLLEVFFTIYRRKGRRPRLLIWSQEYFYLLVDVDKLYALLGK